VLERRAYHFRLLKTLRAALSSSASSSDSRLC
jgi:hypothetical protein